MKRRVLPSAGGVVFIVLFGAFRTPPAVMGFGAPEQPTREELLKTSYSLGGDFLLEERCFHLLRLAQAASTFQPKLAQAWAQEGFQLTRRLPKSWNRVAFQKNFLSTLSLTDPEGAMALLDSVDDPVPLAGGSLPEDVRAHGARTIFAQYWKHKGTGGLETLRQHARHIGDTGEYPFVAVAPIVVDLAGRDRAAAETLFAEALSYYLRGCQMRNVDSEFVALLLATWGSVSSGLDEKGLRAAVGYLTATPPPPPGVVELGSPSEALLFELLPRVRQVDPEWARSLIRSNPRLEATRFPETPTPNMTVSYTSSFVASDALAWTEERAREAQQLSRVRDIAKHDPDRALRLCTGLGDPVYRSQALAIVAQGFRAGHPARGRSLLKTAKHVSDTIPDPSGKVMALTTLAEVGASFGDAEWVRKELGEAFDLGEEAFREFLDTHPGAMAYQADVFDDFGRMIRLGMRLDPGWTATRVAGERDHVLEAYLLVDEVEGLEVLQ